MKKILFSLAIVMAMTSCYNTKVCVGDVKRDDPTVKVNSVTNHHFLFGLIPGGNSKVEASKYVGNKKNYVVKTNQSFVNGFLTYITAGIYTPWTTTYYLPTTDFVKE